MRIRGIEDKEAVKLLCLRSSDVAAGEAVMLDWWGDRLDDFEEIGTFLILSFWMVLFALIGLGVVFVLVSLFVRWVA